MGDKNFLVVAPDLCQFIWRNRTKRFFWDYILFLFMQTVRVEFVSHLDVCVPLWPLGILFNIDPPRPARCGKPTAIYKLSGTQRCARRAHKPFGMPGTVSQRSVLSGGMGPKRLRGVQERQSTCRMRRRTRGRLNGKLEKKQWARWWPKITLYLRLEILYVRTPISSLSFSRPKPMTLCWGDGYICFNFR